MIKNKILSRLGRMLILIIALIPMALMSQDSLYQEGPFSEQFRSPVNYKIRLSGSFGELRNNHFHTGIDIKGKNSTAGDSLVSVMSGYVSRIRVQAGSYGKCLYIDHPNGITSVYAHLDEFSPTIQKIVRKKQIEKKSFEIDLYPTKDAISLDQGDYIGTLGNTGRSYGPHLHFELRDTETELALNPLYFDFGITDRKAPFISQVMIHELDSNLQVLNKKILTGNQSVAKCNEPLIGIGFKGYDTMDGSSNYNGIADIKLYADNKLIYSTLFDTLSFDEFRYINSSIDYEEKQLRNSTYYLCYRQPNNHLSNLKKLKNAGIIALRDTTNVKIVVKDLAGNRSVRELILINNNPGNPILRPSLDAPSDLIKESNKASVFIPSKCLYKKERISFSYDSLTQEVRIGKEHLPCHAYYDLEIRNVKGGSKLKLYHRNKGEWVNIGGHVQQDTFRCKVNRFGRFKLMEDRTEPSIKFLSDALGKLKFTVKDQEKHAGSAEDLYIHASLNGKWIPFYYKELVKQLTFSKKELKTGILRIYIVDGSGNTATLDYRLK